MTYAAKAVHFDGTVLVSGESFVSDSSYGLLSIWFKSDQQLCLIDGPNSGNFAIVLGPSTGSTYLFGTFYDDSNDNYWNHNTVPYSHDCTQWTHFLASWDMNHAAGSRIVQVYVSDVAVDNDPSGDVGVAFTVDLNGSTLFAFREAVTFYGGGVCDAADFYFDTSFLDLSVESNRRKFIDAYGKPVDLGTNGESPTGSPPQIFFSGDRNSFLTNLGSGPTFSHTGILTDASTSPSDSAPPFRIRFSIANTDAAQSPATSFKIYMSKNGGAYSAVTTSSTNGVKSADAGSDADNTIVRIPRLTAGA